MAGHISLESAWCFVFRGAELLVLPQEPGAVLPTGATLAGDWPSIHPVGELEGRTCLAIEAPNDYEPPAGAAFSGLRPLFGRLPDVVFAMAGRAVQVVAWHRDHRYCGRCGTATTAGQPPLSKACPACGALFFPRLSPAVIVAVRRGDRLLLARSPHFAPGMYSTLAGFVEPGESLEQTVAREIREEVGVEVTNMRYFGSQPWPFPNSLMIGFTAEYAGGELVPDAAEIVDAGWFGVEAMPLVPGRISIARALIDDFVRTQGGDPDALRSP